MPSALEARHRIVLDESLMQKRPSDLFSSSTQRRLPTLEGADSHICTTQRLRLNSRCYRLCSEKSYEQEPPCGHWKCARSAEPLSRDWSSALLSEHPLRSRTVRFVAHRAPPLQQRALGLQCCASASWGRSHGRAAPCRGQFLLADARTAADASGALPTGARGGEAATTRSLLQPRCCASKEAPFPARWAGDLI